MIDTTCPCGTIDVATWTEYDSAAEWCARRGHSGLIGSPLPPLLSKKTKSLIDDDPEAFARLVRATAYMIAREGNHG